MTATCTNGTYRPFQTFVYKQPSAKKVSGLSFFREYSALRKDGYHIRFKNEQRIAWGKAEDGYVSLTFKPLNIYAVGENHEEAIQDFWDELEFVWRSYACADDSDLTQDAIELKHRAQQYLTEG